MTLSLWNGNIGASKVIWKDIPAEEGGVEWPVPSVQGDKFRLMLTADSIQGQGMTSTFFSITPTSNVNLSETKRLDPFPSITAYPDPAENMLKVTVGAPFLADDLVVEVMSVKGDRIGILKDPRPCAEGLTYTLDCSHFAPGVYFIRVSCGRLKQSIKFLKD